jgi:hypothetical protein
LGPEPFDRWPLNSSPAIREVVKLQLFIAIQRELKIEIVGECTELSVKNWPCTMATILVDNNTGIFEAFRKFEEIDI